MKKSMALIFFAMIMFCLSMNVWAETYKVKKGDNLYIIQKKTGVNGYEIAEYNGITDPDVIYPGQVLMIPREKAEAESGEDVETAPKTTSSDQATKHIVVDGEYYGKIAREYGIPLDYLILFNKEFNGLINENRIYPQDIILIPDHCPLTNWSIHGLKAVKKGGELTLEEIRVAFSEFKLLSEKRQQLFLAEIEAGRFEIVFMTVGQKRREMLYRDKFGIAPIRNMVVAEQSEKAKRYMIIDGDEKVVLDIPYVCGNLAWTSFPYKAPEKPKEPVGIKPKLETSQKPVAQKIDPPRLLEEAGQKEEISVKQGWNYNMTQENSLSGTLYRSADGLDIDETARGYWLGGTQRLFLFQKTFGEKENMKTFKSGPHVAGSCGESKNDSWEDIWWQGVVGPTFKLEDKNYDFGFDLGFGLKDKKGHKGFYESHQTDKVAVGSLYLKNEKRRNDGKNSIPFWTLSSYNVFSLDSKIDATWKGRKLGKEPDNINKAGLELKVGVYDFSFNNRAFLVTPFINLGRDYGWGRDRFSQKVGFGIDFELFDQEVLTIGCMYKDEIGTGNDAWQIGAKTNPNNIVRAIRSAQVRESKPEEIGMVK